jgi:hypothetical protein
MCFALLDTSTCTMTQLKFACCIGMRNVMQACRWCTHGAPYISIVNRERIYIYVYSVVVDQSALVCLVVVRRKVVARRKDLVCRGALSSVACCLKGAWAVCALFRGYHCMTLCGTLTYLWYMYTYICIVDVTARWLCMYPHVVLIVLSSWLPAPCDGTV